MKEIRELVNIFLDLLRTVRPKATKGSQLNAVLAR